MNRLTMTTVSHVEKNARIICDFLKGKSWTHREDVAQHLRVMSSEAMSMETALRACRAAKRWTQLAENQGDIIITSDDIKGRMGYKIAETVEEFEMVENILNKKRQAYEESLVNIAFHKRRFVNRMKALQPTQLPHSVCS